MNLPAVPDLPLAIQEFKEAVQASFGTRLIKTVLFGSVARMRMHEESDIDILLLLSSGAADDAKLAVDAAVSVMLRRPQFVISPLVLTQERFDELRARERLIAFEIERDGIQL